MRSARAVVLSLVLLAAGCQPIVTNADSERPGLGTSVTDMATASSEAGESVPEDDEAGVDMAAPDADVSSITTTLAVSEPVTVAAGEPATPEADNGAESENGRQIVVASGYRPEQVEAGQVIYRQQYCGVCHKLDAIGTRGTFGPPHDQAGSLAAERVQDVAYTGEAEDAAGYLYESLIKPQIYIVSGYEASAHHMPPYTHLPEEALQALVAFLLAQQ